ncbi:hypothetical protein [Carboxylicivirga linearis]|uniref:Uncharacterized protein n=1 Tax=Carboxylicivirga linearis TaxID=1628157 RepID=A0ABS5JZP1_9BACT|nr:hypothetical protein [Carboxylicivirga linearis]MBS2100379.1 hypothetical protein [Carboxylicivirga linearis]
MMNKYTWKDSIKRDIKKREEQNQVFRKLIKMFGEVCEKRINGKIKSKN